MAAFPGLVTGVIVTAGGQRYDFTPIQKSLKWGSVVNGGFADCSFNVDGDQRDKFIALSIVRLFVGAEIVWEGQLEDPELMLSDGTWQTAVAAFGLQRKFTEQSVRRIWVKRDLDWQQMTSTADAQAVSSGLTVSTGAIDQTDPTRIGVRVSGASAAVNNNAIAGAYISFPAGVVSQILFDLSQAGFAAAWHWLVDWSPDGTTWTNLLDQNVNAYPGGSFSLAVPATAAQIRVHLDNKLGGASTPNSGQYVDMVNIRLLGATTVEDAAGGLYGGTILSDIASQCAGIAPGRIEAGSDFLIQQCTRDTRDTMGSVISEVVAYYLREWYVWEDGVFSWVSVALDQPDWIVRSSEAVSLNLKSTVQPVGSDVIVTFTDVASNPGEGTASATSQRNPYVKQGVKKDVVVAASVPMSTNTAQQLASIVAGDDEQWLPVQGELVVPAAAILSRRGSATPAYAIRAGDNVLIPDLPKSDLFAQGRDGETLFHIREAVADLEAGTVSLTLESQINVADVLLARLGAITNILVGSPSG